MAAGADRPPDQASRTEEDRTRIRKIMYNQRAIPAPA